MGELTKEELGKMYNSLTEEEKKHYEKKTKKLSEIFPLFLIAQKQAKKTDTDNAMIENKEFKDVLVLGSMVRKYCEEFECSFFDFLKEMNAFKQVFIEQGIKSGIGFSEDYYDIPDKLKKKNRENYKNLEKRHQKNEKAPYTLGNALKEKGLI